MEGYCWVLTRQPGLKYSESQPRVPAGSSEGGQWTATGGGAVRSRLEAKGVRVGDTPETAVQLMADAYEERWGWDAEHTREGFIKNQQRLLENSEWPPEEYRERVLAGVEKAVDSGRAGALPVVVRGMREGYNDAWSSGVHEGTHIEIIYNPKRLDASVGGRVRTPERLGDRISVSSLAYDDEFEGTYVHEWGHHVTTSAMERRAASVIDDRRDFIKASVSRYAVENTRELVAEAYALSVHPDFGNLSPDARDFIIWILEGD